MPSPLPEPVPLEIPLLVKPEGRAVGPGGPVNLTFEASAPQYHWIKDVSGLEREWGGRKIKAANLAAKGTWSEKEGERGGRQGT